MGKIAGIDLGTTFSSIACLNDMGRPDIIANADGERVMPSASYIAQDGRVLTGAEAIRSRYDDVSRSIRWIKRHMGDSEKVVIIDNKKYTPAELSALILKKLHQDAVVQVGTINDVVISIPANYEEVARKATMDAGQIAGLNVVGIVNEPTAAAFYYAIVQEISGHVLIFDLGGGTFDISIADIVGKDIKIVASRGDRNLGGYNFDQRLMEYFESVYKKQTGSDLFVNNEEKAEFEDYAEETKKSLSKKNSVKFRLKGSSGTVKGEITQTAFESLISPDLARMEMLIETVLDESGDEPDKIDKVLLVGGSSRIPAVKRMLQRIFGFEPSFVGNVDECVALGAALYAGLRLLEEEPSKVSEGIASGLSDVKVGEVCNHSYGTTCLSYDEVMEKHVLMNDILIKKNSKIPCSISKTYYTTHPNQKRINGDVTQGESSDPELVTNISSGMLDLPADLPPDTPIEITYSYDKDQRMNCLFEHSESGRKLILNIDVESGNSSAQTIDEQRAKLEHFIIE